MFTPPNMSRVTCRLSCVTCHMSHFFFDKVWSLLVEGQLSTGPTPSSLNRFEPLAPFFTFFLNLFPHCFHTVFPVFTVFHRINSFSKFSPCFTSFHSFMSFHHISPTFTSFTVFYCFIEWSLKFLLCPNFVCEQFIIYFTGSVSLSNTVLDDGKYICKSDVIG